MDLVSQAADWGTTITEASARKGPKARVWLATAYVSLALGSLFIVPIAVGTYLSGSLGSLRGIAVLGFLIAAALAFKWKAQSQIRNALQLDYRAGELRLGHARKDGAFTREQVVSFREIERVYVDGSIDGPALCIEVNGERMTMRFNQAEATELQALASRISAARESALLAPVGSRIQSRMIGFEASFREAKKRIRTRIIEPT